MPVFPAILIIYLLTVSVVFFTFFTAKIAQMKLRSGAWGALGLFFGPLGMLGVCYLPSRRKDGKETNPIRSGIRALPGLSRKLFVILLILLVLTLVIIYFADAIPKWRENSRYEAGVGTTVTDRLISAGTIKGTPSAVAAGQDSTYVITEDGDLYTWGYNDLALSMQDKGAAASDVLDVAQMDRAAYVLKKNRKLYRINEEGEQTEIADNVEKVVCGPHFGAFLKTTGDVFVWGNNSYLQLGAAGEASDKPLWLMGNAADLSCGNRHLLILKKDGAVYGCGSNVTGALGLKDEKGNVALKQIASDCKAIAAGGDFSLILTKDGVLKSSGANDCGQLGREIEKDKQRLTFTKVETGVEAIGAGGKFGWYIADQKLYTWGQNHCGQLGRGNAENDAKPAKVLDKVTAAAASADHMAALANGRLYAWGDNTYGQLGQFEETHLSPAAVVAVKK